MSWDTARRHARALETALDAKLSHYSRVAASIASGSGPSSSSSNPYPPSGSGGKDQENDEGEGGYKLVEEEVEELLVKLEQAIDDMTVLINSPSQPPSASMQHGAQRHRDNLDDYKREFGRVRKNVESALQRRNLLGSVRQDINNTSALILTVSDYKMATASQTDALLADRGRIDSSHRMMDETLGSLRQKLTNRQAYATRQDFAQQQTMLARIDQRMGGVLSQMPGINSLISMIHSRRRRDTVIMGLVVGVCVVLLLGYMFGF